MLIVMSQYFILLLIKQVNTVTVVTNNINDPYAKMCVPDVVKNLNVKCSVLCQELVKQET